MAIGCAGSAGPVRVVPSQYDKLVGRVRKIGVGLFENGTRENERSMAKAAGVFVNPVVDQFPNAGEALKDSLMDILSGKLFGATNAMRERADRDVGTPYAFGPSDKEPAAVPFQAISCDAILGPKASLDEVTRAVGGMGAHAIVGGKVESLVVEFVPGAAGASSEGVLATYNTGAIKCKIVFVLYDAQGGSHLMDRVVVVNTLFSHGAYSQPMDKLRYAQACAEKLLYNAAWQFLSDLIPHYKTSGTSGDVGGEPEPMRFEGRLD
jgi:hypothetical protein